MRKVVSFTLAVGFGLAASAAQAQGLAPAKPEDAIKYRKAAMTLVGAHFGALGAMARGDRPFDAAVATANAQVMEQASKLPFEAMFVANTYSGDTTALPKIAGDRDKFMAGATKMQEEVVKLVAAAKTDQAGLRTQFGAVGQTCKACHTEYRKQ
jgi:cytochrome c556